MKMTIKNSLVEGIRAVFYNKKIIALLWGTNAVGALILSLPIYFLLSQELSNSLISDKLALGFDYQWYLQFRNLFEHDFELIVYMIYLVVGVYILGQTFFMGGMISIFNTPKKNHTVDFFYGCVRYWHRFMKVVLVSLFFFSTAFIFNNFLGDLISWLFEGTENELADFILRSIRYVLLIFLIGLVTLISDYCKVSMAIEDNHNFFNSVRKALFFIQRNFAKVFTVFLLVAIIGAIGAVVYNFVERFIPRTPFYFLLVAFILQQMLIIFRLYIRMLFCSTEVYLYKDLSAEEITAEVEEQS